MHVVKVKIPATSSRPDLDLVREMLMLQGANRGHLTAAATHDPTHCSADVYLDCTTEICCIMSPPVLLQSGDELLGVSCMVTKERSNTFLTFCSSIYNDAPF